MIWYDEDDWLCKVVFKIHGSVFPRAALFAIPSALLAILIRRLQADEATVIEDIGLSDLTESLLWSGMTAAIGTLISFRIRQALGRFWEGTGLLHQMRGEWFESAACLVTFSRQAKPTKPEAVAEFRHTLVRLMSLCHGSALDEIKAVSNENFEAIDIDGLDIAIIKHLHECKGLRFNRVEVLLHMLQVLVTQGLDDNVLKIAPPILSRVYQTLSRGLVHLLNAKKIADVKFPFPFTQLITVLLFMYSVFTPVLFAVAVENEVWAALITFFPVFAMFSLDFAAIQLEMPFGDDANDLPLDHFQTEMNQSLLMLLHENSDMKPTVRKTCEKSFLSAQASVRRIGMFMSAHRTGFVVAAYDAESAVKAEAALETPKAKAAVESPASLQSLRYDPESPVTAPALAPAPAPALAPAPVVAAPALSPAPSTVPAEQKAGALPQAAAGASPGRGVIMDALTQWTSLGSPPNASQPPAQSQAIVPVSDVDNLERKVDQTMKELTSQLQSWKHQSALEATALSEVLAINCEAITGLSQSIPHMTDSLGKLSDTTGSLMRNDALLQLMRNSDKQSADLLENLSRNSETVAAFTESMLGMSRTILSHQEKMPAGAMSSVKMPAKDMDDAMYSWMKNADDKWTGLLQALNRNTDAVTGVLESRAAAIDPLLGPASAIPVETAGGCCIPNRSKPMQLL